MGMLGVGNNKASHETSIRSSGAFQRNEAILFGEPDYSLYPYRNGLCLPTQRVFPPVQGSNTETMIKEFDYKDGYWQQVNRTR